MRTLKHHTIEPNTHTALHHCLEAHFGNKRSHSEPAQREYREPEQGFCTVPFQSGYPLQLDYMRRRKSSVRRMMCRIETSHRFTQITDLVKTALFRS